jgi:hypothetical protein
MFKHFLNKMDNINSFKEVISKAKVDYEIFKNFFFQNKDEYVIHNALDLGENNYLVSGLGLYNLFIDYKIKLGKFQTSENFILLKIENSVEDFVEFYYTNEIDKSECFKKLYPKYFLILRSVYMFYDNFEDYFSKIVTI